MICTERDLLRAVRDRYHGARERSQGGMADLGLGGRVGDGAGGEEACWRGGSVGVERGSRGLAAVESGDARGRGGGGGKIRAGSCGTWEGAVGCESR